MSGQRPRCDIPDVQSVSQRGSELWGEALGLEEGDKRPRQDENGVGASEVLDEGDESCTPALHTDTHSHTHTRQLGGSGIMKERQTGASQTSGGRKGSRSS